MTIYLWVICFAYALDVTMRLVWLGTGDFPQRTRANVTPDLAVNGIMLAWTVFLLLKS